METNHGMQTSRRAFIGTAAMAAVTFAIPAWAREVVARVPGKLSIGLITDLHHDVMHDGAERLEAFLREMGRVKPDAIMQLGDFAYPSEKNAGIIERFNRGHALPLHVIGNHDTDSGFTHQQCLEKWGMPATYYTRVVNGFRLIVLNGNEKGSPAHKGGYPAYIGPEQVAWLKRQLAESSEPVIVVSHQPLTGGMAIDNATEIQGILAGAKDRVVLAINGHTHIDSLQEVSGIPYLTINSASYFWVGGKYVHESYPKEIHEKYPWIGHTCPYQDPLFTTLVIDPAKFTIKVKARKSEWVGKSPEQLNFADKQPFRPGTEIVPFIRDRKHYTGKRIGK
ncbi:metallophosphoesterase family protein [Chitinophaga rhizosphaerae]|uniref:metallophosphoesterase family protein n=1 Tax=Chitinophaga rhizosphaerae TaxID=1864947 RepID=UPI0013E0B240|nr:metallophosphoesterase [Chitinophaga rhizosphaerae]